MAAAKNEVAEMSPPSIIDCVVENDLVVVEVGPTSLRYSVHKRLLVYHSEYCQNTLRGPWMEAQQGVVPLTDVEPAIFNLFVFWMYKQRLPIRYNDAPNEEWFQVLQIKDKDSYGPFIITEACLKAHVFADQYLCEEYGRVVHDQAVSLLECDQIQFMDYHYRIAATAFEIIPADRPVLQLIVDSHRNSRRPITWSVSSDKKQIAELKRSLPHAYLQRLMRRFEDGKHNVANEEEEEDEEGEGEEEKDEVSRCYYEHRDDSIKEECGLRHLEFNEDEQYGYFPSNPGGKNARLVG